MLEVSDGGPLRTQHPQHTQRNKNYNYNKNNLSHQRRGRRNISKPVASIKELEDYFDHIGDEQDNHGFMAITKSIVNHFAAQSEGGG